MILLFKSLRFIFKIISGIIFLRILVFGIIHVLSLLLLFISVFFARWIRRIKKYHLKKPRLFFGPIPLINNKYYALALRKKNYRCQTVMNSYFSSINKPDDFDRYLPEYAFGRLEFIYYLSKDFEGIASYFCFIRMIFDFDVFHFSFFGGPLHNTILKNTEAQMIRWCGGKTVVLPYGADMYAYSRVLNKSWTHTLLTHYPYFGKNEQEIDRQVKYWSRHADAIIAGMQIDGLGRWEALPFRAECIDVEAWKPKKTYSQSDGKNGTVFIVHAPNHRFIKGTEYLLDAVEKLKEKDGLKVEVIIIEKMQNTVVKQILEEKADILFDQLILGYAMFAIEGFASGLPVVTNLENEDYVRVFRRYSYLNECPAVSASHETLYIVLKKLVTRPGLRETLGRASRKYAEKYHSFKTVQSLFEKLYDKIWYNKTDIDLMNFFHPLLPESYNNQSEKIKHPLVENKIID